MAGAEDPDDAPQIISAITVISLSVVLSIILFAYTLNRTLLPKDSPTKLRLLFVWHMFDAIVHFLLEGSYLYNCFFSWAPFPNYDELPDVNYFPVPMTPSGVWFLGETSRLYGSFYGKNPMASLWREYSRADRRWGGTDLTIISLELLTVFIMGPLAIYVCNLLRKQQISKAFFWMTVIATGELYGGFMTFAPEWLTGSPNLDTSNFIFLWIYLVFFNAGLWVVIPLWILYESYQAINDAFATSSKGRIPRTWQTPVANKKRQ